MVYPVGAQLQQHSVNISSQPSIADTRREQAKVEDSTEPSGTKAARSEASETRNNGRTEDSRARQYAADDRARDSGAVYSSSSRGTQVDVSA